MIFLIIIIKNQEMSGFKLDLSDIKDIVDMIIIYFPNRFNNYC